MLSTGWDMKGQFKLPLALPKERFKTCLAEYGAGHGRSVLSLAGAATSIIFVATNSCFKRLDCA